MKKSNIIIATIILATSIGCITVKRNLSRSYHHLTTMSVDLSAECVGDIYLGENIHDEKIVKLYGDNIESSKDNLEYDYLILENGLEVATNKNDSKIVRIIASNTGFSTNKGVKINDSKNDIIRAYGESYYKRQEQGRYIKTYFLESLRT